MTVNETGQRNDKCDLCDEEAIAFWVAANPVCVCRKCAIEILPALIADSVVSANHSSALAVWNRIESIFWRAMAAAASRRAYLPKESPDPDVPDREYV